MKTFEEMKLIARTMYQYKDEEGDYGEIESVVFKVGDKEIHPRTRCEPEDAIWARDLGDVFDDGEDLGMRAMYLAFKRVTEGEN